MAKDMGYHVSGTANSFRNQESRLIGVIVPDLSIHFFARVVQGIEDVLSNAGYGILLFDSREQMATEVRSIQKCLSYRVDGVLAAISMKTDSFDHFVQLTKHEVPLVFYDRVANFLSVPKVITNDYEAAYEATNHLIQTGHKHIAHITASINLNNSNNRLYGYMDALKDAGIDIDENLIHYYELDLSSIDRFVTGLFHIQPSIDSIFVFNDHVANYTVNTLHRLGKHVPEDISVMGFSDEPIATYMTPQLSSVKHGGEKMGNLAAQKLLSLIRKEEPLTNEKIVIHPELIIRESTKSH